MVNHSSIFTVDAQSSHLEFWGWGYWGFFDIPNRKSDFWRCSSWNFPIECQIFQLPIWTCYLPFRYLVCPFMEQTHPHQSRLPGTRSWRGQWEDRTCISVPMRADGGASFQEEGASFIHSAFHLQAASKPSNCVLPERSKTHPSQLEYYHPLISYNFTLKSNSVNKYVSIYRSGWLKGHDTHRE